MCVVGDDAQSIYSFRGADIDNILYFTKVYPNTKVFKLEQNYRSTQTIVCAANSLIEKNERQIRKEVFSEKEKGEAIGVFQAYSDVEEGDIAVSYTHLFEDVLRRLISNVGYAVQTIAAAKVKSTNALVESSNQLLFTILKTSYNHYSPKLEKDELEKIRPVSYTHLFKECRDNLVFFHKKCGCCDYNELHFF